MPQRQENGPRHAPADFAGFVRKENTMIAEPKLPDTVERGQSIFETQIEPRLIGENPDDFLAIDILSGDYEIAPDDLTPSQHLRERHPDAVIFLRRVGDEAAYSVGGGYQE